MTLNVYSLKGVLLISTHTPLARRDIRPLLCATYLYNFYSHASCEAWLWSMKPQILMTNFYSHASCEAWLARAVPEHINIPFLLTRLLRGVTITGGTPLATETFLLTRLLRGVTGILRDANVFWKFLLTRLLRGVTILGIIIMLYVLHFYSHASCEAWPSMMVLLHGVV